MFDVGGGIFGTGFFSKSRDPGISLIFSSIFLEIVRDFSGLTFFYGIFN